MTQTVRQAIMATIANSSACIVQKIEAGKALVEDITRISNEALVELDQIKKDASACLENIDGVKAIVSATACVGKVSLRREKREELLGRSICIQWVNFDGSVNAWKLSYGLTGNHALLD